jgi:FxsC-like protein
MVLTSGRRDRGRLADSDDMNSPLTAAPHLPVFMVEMAAPTQKTAASDLDHRCYGESSSDWRPFPQQEFPLAEYASQVIRRLDLETEICGIKTVSDPRSRRPGIILIDPWFIAADSGRTALESAVGNLPRWVMSLLILNQPDDARTQKLADQVREILYTAGALPTDSSRRAARGVSSLQDFIAIVRVLVSDVERQYLRYRNGQYWSGQKVSSPSDSRPDGSASTPDQPGETPDA